MAVVLKSHDPDRPQWLPWLRGHGQRMRGTGQWQQAQEEQSTQSSPKSQTGNPSQHTVSDIPQLSVHLPHKGSLTRCRKIQTESAHPPLGTQLAPLPHLDNVMYDTDR